MEAKFNFTLTQIEYVIAVEKHGHFARAAEACNVTQPTLSMQIQKLEEMLDVTLFDRSKKPILVTDAGQKLIEQFKVILFESAKISDLLLRSKNLSGSGRLSVGIIPTVAPYLLPRLLPVLERDFPGLELDISEKQTHRIIEDLNSDDLDVGILATPLSISQINEHPLYYEPFLVLSKRGEKVSEHKRVRYNSLDPKKLWLLSEGHCLRNQVLDVCSNKTVRESKRPYRFESGSLETLKKLVDNYGGYTLLPVLATDDIGSHSQLAQFERPIPAREIGLVYRRKDHKADLIESLAESILKCIPEEVRKIRPKDLEVLPVEEKK